MLDSAESYHDAVDDLPIVGEKIQLVPLRCLLWEIDITTRDTSTSGPHDAGLADWHRNHILVQDVHVVVGCRGANVDCIADFVQLHRIDDGNLQHMSAKDGALSYHETHFRGAAAVVVVRRCSPTIRQR